MAMPDKLSIRNGGTRRMILGPPAKSKGGGKSTLLGTSDDAKVANIAKNVSPQVVTLDGEAAAHWRTSKVLAGVKDHFGIQVA